MYYYTVYGLNLKSPLRLDELLRIEPCEPDVTLELADPESMLCIDGDTWSYATIRGDECQLDFPGTGSFLISDGVKIVLQPSKGVDALDCRSYLLGSAFAALLYQRDQVPLHTSCIDLGGQSVLFSGPSGAGKSTIAYFLCQSGVASLVADDVTVLTRSGSTVYPRFGPRKSKLWGETLEHFGLPSSTYERDRMRVDKFHVPIPNPANDRQPSPVTKMYVLGRSKSDAWEKSPMTDVEKFHYFLASAYRAEIGCRVKSDEFLMRSCLEMIPYVDISYLNRPWDLGRMSVDFCSRKLVEFLVR
ncbi:MAG: hypothetical protein ACXIUL_00745 [Wenzhouxiangella sp.]